jgi:predicted SprT family Zn-dependent metalloprotease
MCYVCCSFDEPPVRLLAAHRLLAVKADQDMARAYLESLGFQGLRPEVEGEDIIKFRYSAYDPVMVMERLGKPKAGTKTDSIRFTVDGSGTLAIWPKLKRVTLLNKGRKKGGAVKKILTPAPRPDNKEAPHPPPVIDVKEPRTGTENDDANVPNVPIPAYMSVAYMQLGEDKHRRLRFMTDLWKYFNEHKFDHKLTMPKLALSKDTGTRMRRRGVWFPGKRMLAIAPSVFNARLKFFVEVFLHEMCHQATSEASNMSVEDQLDNERHKGHGRVWSRWMRTVGLNPLRYDPNENTTYMTEEQKDAHAKEKAFWHSLDDEAKARGLRLVRSLNYGDRVYVKRTGGTGGTGLIPGVAVCRAKKAGNQWAIVPLATVEQGVSPTVALNWMVNAAATVYADPNSKNMAADPKFNTIGQRIYNFYARKQQERLERSIDKRINRGWL